MLVLIVIFIVNMIFVIFGNVNVVFGISDIILIINIKLVFRVMFVIMLKFL